jgi:acetyl esterase/lipase
MTAVADDVLAETQAFNAELERQLAANPATHEMPVEVARRQRREGGGIFPPPTFLPDRARDLTIEGRSGPIGLRVIAPEQTAVGAYLHIHGGGWALSAANLQDPLLVELADATGLCVVSVDYRLAPEHPYPAAVEDAYAATAWASRNAAALGGAQHRLAVAGDSAGGNLAAAVALGARDRGGPAIAFQLLVYPVLDVAGDTGSWAEFAEGYYLTAAGMRWYWDHYLAGADGGAPDASPLRAAFVGGLPPALVIGADHDILRDEGEAYADRLRDAGVDATATRYPGVVHGFFRWRAVTAAADTALQEAATALRSALAPPGA